MKLIFYISRCFLYLGVQRSSMPRNTFIRILEKIIEEFVTSQYQQCFIRCRNDPLCLGQNIVALPNKLFNCKLFTLEEHVTSSVSVFNDLIVT